MLSSEQHTPSATMWHQVVVAQLTGVLLPAPPMQKAMLPAEVPKPLVTSRLPQMVGSAYHHRMTPACMGTLQHSMFDLQSHDWNCGNSVVTHSICCAAGAAFGLPSENACNVSDHTAWKQQVSISLGQVKMCLAGT